MIGLDIGVNQGFSEAVLKIPYRERLLSLKGNLPFPHPVPRSLAGGEEYSSSREQGKGGLPSEPAGQGFLPLVPQRASSKL